MGEFFEEHGTGGDIKAARPENKEPQGNIKAKTKVPIAPNKNEGAGNEPSHSTLRPNDHHHPNG